MVQNSSRLWRALSTCALGALLFVVAWAGLQLATMSSALRYVIPFAVLLLGLTLACSGRIPRRWRRTPKRDRTEEALRDSEARLKLVFDSTSDALLLFAVEGERRYRLVMANPAFRRRLAQHRPEWAGCDPVGLSIEKLMLDVLRFPPELLRGTHERFATAIRMSEPLRYESHDWGSNDEVFDVTLVAVHDERGRCTHVLRSSRNATDRVQAEQRRLRLEAELVQAQKMEAIGTLAGGIAHDFNNMLTAIVGNAELARAELPDDSVVHEDLDQLVHAAARARELVQQILLFSRKRDFQRTPLQPGDVVRDVMRLLRASLPATIDLRLDDRAAGVTVLADATQLHQVLMNLCTNAAQAMDHWTGTIGIEQRVVVVRDEFAERHPGLRAGRCVRITVRDTGRGMDPRTMARVFEPFFTTKPPGVGSGLGLSVVHGIVRKHDGAIEVESTLGAGTAFHVYLPLVDGALPHGVEPLPLGAAPPGRGERVLLVDDEPIVVLTVQRLLERLGYEVTAFASAGEALAAFSSAPDRFDIVVSDLTMPGLTGAELSARMHAARPDLPIVIATGNLDQIDAERARVLGVTRLLAKPFDTQTLARVIRDALRLTA